MRIDWAIRLSRAMMASRSTARATPTNSLSNAWPMRSTRMESMYDELHRNDCLTHRRIEALTDLVQILTDSHTGTYATVVDHCARLLREKKTLMSMIDRQRGLNEPVWENPFPSPSCAFASTHRPG